MESSVPTSVFNSLSSYEKIAAKKIGKAPFDYIAGGAGDESGLKRCREDLDSIRLVSRVLRNVENIDISTKILGQRLSFPILVAPTAYHSIAHPQGEIETARGAKAAGTT